MSSSVNVLKRVLIVNAASSVLLGALLIADTAPLAELLLTDRAQIAGLDGADVLRLLGIGLLPFAAFVYWAARSALQSASVIRAIFFMDVAWVIASAGLLAAAPGVFTGIGATAFAAVALSVAYFAYVEGRSLKRLGPQAAATA